MKRRPVQAALIVAVLLGATISHSQPNVAPGFGGLPDGAKIVLIRPSVAMLESDAAGAVRPRLDWSREAAGNIRQSLLARNGKWRVQIVELADRDDADFGDLKQLYGAVGTAIAFHHFGSELGRLNSKKGQLDWSVGPASGTAMQKTDATHAVFIEVGDIRGTDGRVILGAVGPFMMFLMPRTTPHRPGPSNVQLARAILVELESGRVLWASSPLVDASGAYYDFRKRAEADEALTRLFNGFPAR